MVMLNPSNSTSLPIPIFAPQFVINEQGQPKKAFTMEPDWLAPRTEISNGYKRFYSLVARRAMRFGFADLSIEGLAKNLGVCERTIKNYVGTSRKLKLMDIISTGRSLRFMIVWHEWMPISQDQAEQEKIVFMEKNAPLTGNFFQGQTPQTQQNEIISDSQKSLETNLIDHEDKEASQAPSSGTALGTTEEKDHAENVISFPATTHHVQQLPERQDPASLLDSQKIQPQIKPTEQPLGKYNFEQYLEFAQNEAKKGKKIFSIDGLAKHLHKTGSQDPQVARFLKVNLDSQNIKNSSLGASNSEQSLSKEEIEKRKLIAIGKEAFEKLEDWEQAELQDEKLEGMDFFFTCSMTVQNALLEAIRQDIYLELAEMN